MKLHPKLYHLADLPSNEEAQAAGFESRHHVNGNTRRLMAMETGEFRVPVAGEWFLSETQAYKTHEGMSGEYHILRLVAAKRGYIPEEAPEEESDEVGTDLYPLGEVPSDEEAQTFGFPNGYASVSIARRRLMAKKTGEFRCPRTGEWFLLDLGKAYQAERDMKSEHHIVRLIPVTTAELDE